MPTGGGVGEPGGGAANDCVWLCGGWVGLGVGADAEDGEGAVGEGGELALPEGGEVGSEEGGFVVGGAEVEAD